jgi:S-adenosylmethionine:tRNA ribosyltransferase-isomerase
LNPKKIAASDYTYPLPADRIAIHPLPERDQSKLLIWDNENISQDIYKNIAAYLPAGSLMIFNDTRVIQARLLFKKNTGAVIEIFCLEPYGSITGYERVLAKTGSVEWKCMIGGASKWKGGPLEKLLRIDNEDVHFKVMLKEKIPGAYVAEFSWMPTHFTFADILEHAGNMPLPPYIKRESDEEDVERYQTIYAKFNGSVAAPTAGLHFTPQILSSLKNKNIGTAFVTLHVGAGTFKPITTETLEKHQMHAEWMDLPLSVLTVILENLDAGITAVGTTSLRTLESLYWMGVKCTINPGCDIDSLEIGQWDPYDPSVSSRDITPANALNALLKYMVENNMDRLLIRTGILIVPGYRFKIVSRLVTNFHQPHSTLLLLVAAAVGDDWKRIYHYALENDFRFLSYGDGCLLNIS